MSSSDKQHLKHIEEQKLVKERYQQLEMMNHDQLAEIKKLNQMLRQATKSDSDWH